ncbi:uncharacterized protein [Dermacentor albipictus]|uniref:uncharacterized protein isoform X2 n=1 Tax=Dermacentor albipictus TaxID=60249 RepID=UPI0031FD040A
MAADAAVAPPDRVPISAEGSSDTVSPSSYLRPIDSVETPDSTSVSNRRERFMVLVMSILLLLISCTLFAVLFTLLTDDVFGQPTVVGMLRLVLAQSLLLHTLLPKHSR